MRVRSLAPLLTRENVKAVLGVGEARSVSITVRFGDGATDTKTICLAAGGSLALLILEDNPHGLAAGAFYDIRPQQ